jgi:hypothetical protein
MRKLLLSLCCALFVAGLVVADEVVLKTYKKDTKEATVTDKDGKDATYKLTDKTKVIFTDKDGNTKEASVADAEKILGSDKAPGKAKFDVTTDKDNTITEIKFKSRKGK